MHYEMHLTVSLSPNTPDSINRFKVVCGEMGVKPIVILADPLVDVMTSFRMETDDQNEVFHTMNRHVITLLGKGYHVVRTKVETEVTHPAALTPLPNQYFESHVQVEVSHEDMVTLRELREGLDFHLSRNAFKVLDNGNSVMMATLREYHTAPDRFTARVEAFRKILEAEGISVHKNLEIEFALYDSNVKHDQPWLDLSYSSRQP